MSFLHALSVTCAVSYQANIAAITANIGSHHYYMHSQLPSQYRSYYSQYWFTSLLHALISYRANIAATIANIGSHHYYMH